MQDLANLRLRMRAPEGFGGISFDGKPLKPSRATGHYFVPHEHILAAKQHGLVPDPEIPEPGAEPKE